MVIPPLTPRTSLALQTFANVSGELVGVSDEVADARAALVI
jgi:hypothetical protein